MRMRTLLGTAVLSFGLAACAGNPEPGEPGYAFNVNGEYAIEFVADDGQVYTGTMQLETRPEDPYSVNIAYTVLNGTLYANAGDTETQWAKNMTADPRVRLRIEGALYELRAERVTEASEIAAFAEAWTDQSIFRRDPTGLEQVWLYRLVAR